MPAKKPIPTGFAASLGEYVCGEASTTDIAQRHGVSKATVLKWMDAAGVARTNKFALISAKLMGGPGNSKPRSDETRALISLRKRERDACRPKAAKKAKREKLSTDELKARAKSREACKRLLRRVLVMVRVRKDKTTEVLLGYGKDQLRAHLESQFRPGMSWSERESFHIDHIRPVSDFLRKGITCPSVINALPNLQVLTPEENRKKGDRIDRTGTRPLYG